MTTFQTVADRVEIQALQAEFTDAAMMRDRPRMAALFTADGVLRMPDVPIELTGPEQIRAGGEKLQEQWDFFIQNTHPGAIRIDGDTATGRAHMHEVVRLHNGIQGINYAIYHDRYRRTADGWRFAERVYEIRYLDTSPLAGTAPNAPWAPQAVAAADGAARPAFTDPASEAALDRAAAALTEHGFTVEVLDDAAAARARVRELLPEQASVFTTASETLRLSGIDEDVNARPDAVKPRVLAMDRAAGADELRRLIAAPDVVLGSVTAVTETGSLLIASASGSQLPANAGGAGHAIWVVGAQKVVPDLPAALRRLEEHAVPLEQARALEAYGQGTAVNQLLVLNAATRFARGTVLLLREAIGY
ncbi:nuclear transport factor 2 family protein [Streptomyces sp. TLI_171]|uniref:nuclear transport factor 2 family protein n=1 Tax=Streptomyces sp. TLI_171 TaxID=1938859 RepID=UPI000C1A7990|nr:nuclear transport factor 2 family protein [Streptomyces sp. TLI_171]RKE22444.1 SnoaL-like protein [Streptomyces sp. TLI_171]